MDAQFLNQYESELAYLRQSGNEFAARFPTLAGRLGMDEFHCSDPFVERLLEGFAFLSARVHRRLDAEFPRFTTALLDSVFPLATRPIPSTGIFRIDPVLDEGSLLAGYKVPRGSRLQSSPAPHAQTGCRFDLTDDVHLWPLRIDDVEFLSRDQTSPQPLPESFQDPHIRSVLLITLSITVPAPFSALPLDQLRFHLRGGEIAHQLTEYMLGHACGLAIQTVDAHGGAKWDIQSSDCVRPVGFEQNQSLFPHDHRVFSGHRLLQEYFMLPEKFMFVDLCGLQPAIARATTGTVRFAIAFNQSTPRLVGRVASEHISLFCAPAINLFKRRTDRVWLDTTQHEHQLIADRSRVNDYEIWSIENMTLHSTVTNQEFACQPMYASNAHDQPSSVDSLYYGLERRPRVTQDRLKDARTAYLGTDAMISLTDSSRSPRIEEFQQLSATTYCTNRALPLLTPANGWRDAFQIETAGPFHRVVCLIGPTCPRPALASVEGETAWRLVNHLTPNYTSLVDDDVAGCSMLRELLRLFCPSDHHAGLRQIDGVQNVRNAAIVRRIQAGGPLSYARGVEIELCCDEQAFDGGNAFLLGAVLEQFFARYATLNSFTELHLTSSQRGSIYRWSPRSGTTPLL